MRQGDLNNPKRMSIVQKPPLRLVGRLSCPDYRKLNRMFNTHTNHVTMTSNNDKGADLVMT